MLRLVKRIETVIGVVRAKKGEVLPALRKLTSHPYHSEKVVLEMAMMEVHDRM